MIGKVLHQRAHFWKLVRGGRAPGRGGVDRRFLLCAAFFLVLTALSGMCAGDARRNRSGRFGLLGAALFPGLLRLTFLAVLTFGLAIILFFRFSGLGRRH